MAKSGKTEQKREKEILKQWIKGYLLIYNKITWGAYILWK